MELISSDVLHIPLRPGRPILIHGCPPDLTLAEAEKIRRVLLALAEKQSPTTDGEKT